MDAPAGLLAGFPVAAQSAVLPRRRRNGEQVTGDERILNAFVKHWGLTLEEAREELAKAKAERREAEKQSLWNEDKDWDYYPTYPEKKEQ